MNAIIFGVAVSPGAWLLLLFQGYNDFPTSIILSVAAAAVINHLKD